MPEARLHVKVRPGARANRVLGFQGEALRVQVTAPPELGRANEAVVRVVAEALGVAKSRISVVTGAASRDKVLLVEGMGAAELRRRLQVSLDEP